jgi:hypothetical protein
VFQVILIHFLLISTESETFQQTGQTISQSDSDSTEKHFSGKTEMFLFLSESEAVLNAPLVYGPYIVICNNTVEPNLISVGTLSPEVRYQLFY